MDATNNAGALRERVAALADALEGALDRLEEALDYSGEGTPKERRDDEWLPKWHAALAGTATVVAEHDARVRAAALEEAAQIALAEKMPDSFGVLTDATDAADDTMARTIANAIRARIGVRS
jgi:hypothetical protein